MTKVIGMLVALAMFCAMPAVALAQDSGGGGNDNIASGNDQDNTQNGEANASGGGDAGVQQGSIQQNAGRDANAEINQSQNFGGDNVGGGGGDFDGDNDGVSGDDDDDVSGHGHGHGGGDVGGGSVQSVNLARTGFDAWVLALIGGISLAGGLGLLAAQRRGRLSA